MCCDIVWFPDAMQLCSFLVHSLVCVHTHLWYIDTAHNTCLAWIHTSRPDSVNGHMHVLNDAVCKPQMSVNTGREDQQQKMHGAIQLLHGCAQKHADVSKHLHNMVHTDMSCMADIQYTLVCMHSLHLDALHSTCMQQHVLRHFVYSLKDSCEELNALLSQYACTQ